METSGTEVVRRGPSTLVQLGRYELLKRIAVGGMAELFLARTTAQHGYEKIVALKRVLASHAEDEQFVEMFLAEIRLAASLHHPNIVQVHDAGEADGSYYFTMEYVFGQDVRKILRALQAREQPLPLEHALAIAAGTAAGLHYAHERESSTGAPLGIVHRDVSPSNIVVSYDGAIKLLDFGIARVNSMQVQTGQGVLKGKVPYMSPEQCRGLPLDRRSDIFSLGIVLWEMTTGRRLYHGSNDLVIAGQICGEDAPLPSSVAPNYPGDLEDIVMKALARDRDQRYATAQELQIALEELARDHLRTLSSARLATFMAGLFADQIRESKTDLRKRIVSVTGMFPAVPEELAPPGLIPPKPAPRSPPTDPVIAEPATLPSHKETSDEGSAAATRPETPAEPDPRRTLRRQARIGLGVSGLAAAILLLFGGGDPPVPEVLAASAEPQLRSTPLVVVPLAEPAKPAPAKKRRGPRKGKR